MYLLAHAMAGVLIGLILAAIVRDRRVVLLGALGGVLPDLIDKPLGHIILAETVGYTAGSTSMALRSSRSSPSPASSSTTIAEASASLYWQQGC